VGLLVFFVPVISPTTLVPPATDLPTTVGRKGSGPWVRLAPTMVKLAPMIWLP